MVKIATGTETITAISTPPGSGGIGVIRISGTKSLPILKEIFLPHSAGCSFKSHQMFYGQIVQPGSNKILDEVLAVFMRGPKTYTREDVVEIHCHGSFLILQAVLELIVSSGAILAEPGEFTKRAYLNGRIDLTKAEAVIDILSAKTRKGVDLAQEQLAGALYSRIDAIRQILVHIKAILEVSIDFPDEDIDIVDHQRHLTVLEQDVEAPLSRLIQNADQGRMVREGLSMVIVGLPNVGKSSLLNTLLQEERALVTSIPGTTRDSIEEVIDIHGMPVRIVDTAGIRDNADEVEELGIKRARELINSSDLVLFIYDGAKGFGNEDIELFDSVSHKPLIIVQNKQDLAGEECALPDRMGRHPKVCVSAKMQNGIEQLKDTVFSTVVSSDDQWQEDGCVPNMRHKDALIRGHEACLRLQDGFRLGATSDLLAIDLQECLDQLSDIVGDTTTEDVLDVIFEQFCLGK